MASDRLRKVLVDAFNLDELEVLAVEAGAKWENLRGDTLLSKVNALIGWAERHDRLFTLTMLVVKARPDSVKDWL